MNSKWKHLNTCNVAKKKGPCEWRQTRKWDKKNQQYINHYEDIIQFCEVHSRYLQVSTGLNHAQRDMIIVDVDTDVGEPYDFAHRFLPILPNYANLNTSNGHCQFYYILDNPVKKDSDEWKFLLNFSRKYGDRGFTGWQCRNPLFDGKSEEGKIYKSVFFHGEKFDPSVFGKYVSCQGEGVGSSSTSLIMCKCYTFKEGGRKRVSPNLGKKMKGVGRNNSSFVLTGQWLGEFGRSCDDAKELFPVWKRFNLQVSGELGKEPSPEREGWATCEQLLKYKRAGKLKFMFCGKGNEISQKIRRENADKRLADVENLLFEGRSRNEIAMILGVSRMTVYRDIVKIREMEGDGVDLPSSLYMCKCYTPTMVLVDKALHNGYVGNGKKRAKFVADFLLDTG